VVDDSPSNGEDVFVSEKVIGPFVVDLSPPQVDFSGGKLVVRDMFSGVKVVRLLLTNGRRKLLVPVDGFYGGKEEVFVLPEQAGAVVVGVEDEFGNSAVYTLKK